MSPAMIRHATFRFRLLLKKDRHRDTKVIAMCAPFAHHPHYRAIGLERDPSRFVPATSGYVWNGHRVQTCAAGAFMGTRPPKAANEMGSPLRLPSVLLMRFQLRCPGSSRPAR